MTYSIKPVVSDYGLYENDKLILILNSSRNARLIKAILEKDELCNKDKYIFRYADFMDFLSKEIKV
jgi:hypothetical protein